MIELAPNSKRGLELTGPLILAAGGYGREFDIATLAHAHALATLPTSLHPRAPLRGATRVVELPGGTLVKRAGANPGLDHVLRTESFAWQRINLPVILTLGSADLLHWGEIARRAAQLETVSGLELEIREEMDVAAALVRVKAETDLAVLAWIPMERSLQLAESALAGGADALTVSRPPRGVALVSGRIWHGRLMGPPVLPLAVRVVREITEHFPEIPVIGAGGVQSAADVHTFLAAGARAVQVDVAVWRDPDAFMKIAIDFESSNSKPD